VFSASDKGGTGRSVTSCNLAYRLSLRGKKVAYHDFDFGSPTAGALFEIGAVERGETPGLGLHSYLLGQTEEVTTLDVRLTTDRPALRKSSGAQLVLLPGDLGGAEFTLTQSGVSRCVALLLKLEHEYDVTMVDLSAGRSVALQLALQATATPQLAARTARWLVFHRWTRQHILAAGGLVYGPYGLLATGVESGHDGEQLRGAIRYVRTAVPTVDATGPGSAAQAAWLREQNLALKRLASTQNLGPSALLGVTPLEPVLQWREQILLNADASAKIVNQETVDAFDELSRKLNDPAVWERF
jgi:hypothetical protein